MSEPRDLGRLRNLGIIAHIDAGKTTLSERLLFFSGAERRMGEVHEGSTVLDWMPEERRRGITITLAAATVPWRGHALQIVDTPGHVDFSVEVERAMRVLDGAVLVISALAGVQAQSEAVWTEASRHGVPTLTFVNQLDRVGADFLSAVAEIERRFKERAVVLHYPLGEGESFNGFVDLVTERAFVFERGQPREIEVPEDVRDMAGVLRSDLLDFAAEWDDELLAQVIDGETVDPVLLRRALRRATLARQGHLVLCGSAFRNIGIQSLLDAVVDFLPSPLERPLLEAVDPVTGDTHVVAPELDAPALAYVFKVQHVGDDELDFVRAFRGRLRSGGRYFVPRLGREVVIARIVRVHADGGEDVEAIGAGEIGALLGGSELTTGDTLCAPGSPLALESRAFSEPVLTQVLEPELEEGRAALSVALREMCSEDPTLHAREDHDTGQWLLSGMGELHLEVAVRRLLEDYRVEVRTSRPAVAYREAVRSSGRGSGSVERQVGVERVWGRLEVELTPEPDSGRFEVSWGCPAPKDRGLRAAIEEALERSAQVGPRFGFPLIHARATLLEVGAQGGGGEEQAVVQAAGLAMREAMRQATCELLEPLAAFEVDVPGDHASSVLADLASKRAKIGSVVADGDWRRIVGEVPLALLFGYSTAIRSLSQGRARFNLRPSGFRAVSPADQRERGLLWS
ncbi:Elongation factor G [Planctomycetes bacterium Pla163]|uniref:Elongation factor G n=1 Tax=Rohdeia mirabilis TaxID=2528008 RepID=A0A518D2X0_9BACT|nr:Elongation factor G [Planctomycetes bacterium Pla163]